ncbi:MAG: hypothetical protein MPN21_22780 [Thermoanaerobaculia bacterium]|nr:hypothetical protein [Thermoanaerobaculia bacterium]
MRVLLEFRMSDRWTGLLVTVLFALLVAVLIVSQKPTSFDAPSRPLLIVSLFVLGAYWYDSRRIELMERAETREALHAVLPASRLEQGLVRAVEPTLPLVPIVLLVSSAFWVVGWSTPTSIWKDDLLLFLGAAAWALAMESAKLVVMEVGLVMRSRGLTWLFWIGIAVCFGGPGMFLGYLLGDGKTIPWIFYLLFAHPGSILFALMLGTLLAWLSVLMYRNRDAVLSRS